MPYGRSRYSRRSTVRRRPYVRRRRPTVRRRRPMLAGLGFTRYRRRR